ncbi:MAG: IS3 family transposase [Gammaproteobacteria bacterium]|nr:IS3 family transposase [Gammaproteobacteria bacterium]
MGRVRTCADNASVESVFGQLKRELVRRCQIRTRQEAAEKINHYFLNFYNPWRRPPLLSNKPNAIQACNSREQDAVC